MRPLRRACYDDSNRLAARRSADRPCSGRASLPLAGLLLATLSCSRPATTIDPPPGPVPAAETPAERLFRVVAEYDAQGIHRTGTEVDQASAAWLADSVARAGFSPELETFPFRRLDPQQSYLEVGGLRLAGIPAFDGAFTDDAGIVATLWPLDGAPRDRGGPGGGGDAIALVHAGPGDGSDKKLIERRRSGQHRALVAVVGGARFEVPEGYALINAEHMLEPYGLPVLQLPSESEPRLLAAAAAGERVRLVSTVSHTVTEVANVTVAVPGTRPELEPVVVMTPRSGWWHCASERGPGIALWLELLHRMRARPPERPVLMVATTGHELGHLGLHHYLAAHPERLSAAHAWIHLGANLGAARNPALLVQASDQTLLGEWQAALARHGIVPDRVAPVGERPIGEARNVFDGGGRYLSVLGRSGFFHSPLDRHPEAVDFDRLAALAEALAVMFDQLTRGPEETSA